MAAVAAGIVFADEPTVNTNITTFTGNSSVVWGVDLDDGGTGFKNDTAITFKINMLNAGDKATEGEGIWGDLQLKAGNAGWWTNQWVNYDNVKSAQNGVQNANSSGISLVIDHAKIHVFGAYVGIMSGDTQVGELKLDSAIRSNDNDNSKYLANVGENKDQGIVAGYANQNLQFDLDFRSKAGAEDFYNNDYGLAFEAQLLSGNTFLPGLFGKVGASVAFKEKKMAWAASVGYKLSLSDTFYLKPVVGYTGAATLDPATSDENTLAGGVLLGWGETADANAGVYYLDNDGAKKVTPGLSFNFKLPLTNSTTNKLTYLTLIPSLYTGTIVPNLTAGLISQMDIPFIEGAEFGVAVIGGVKYDLKVSDGITVTPQVGARFANKASLAYPSMLDQNKKLFDANTDNGGVKDNNNMSAYGLLNLKAGIDISGLISNTTFSFWYQSRNLLDTADGAKKAGTLNVSAKIAL